MVGSPPTNMALYRRMASGVWLLSAILTAGLCLFAPPDVAIGPAGWWIAALIVLNSLFLSARLALRGPYVSPNELAWTAFAGVIQNGVMQWLAGGLGEPFYQLLLLSVFATAAMRRRVTRVVYLSVIAAVAAAPFVYDHWEASAAGSTISLIVLLVCIAALLVQFVSGTDAQKRSLRKAERRAKRSARTDALTGLGNRRAFDEFLAQELVRARRTQGALTLIVGDLDGFKRVNDDFGHLTGDELLDRSAEAIESAMRRGDRCFRWGGDEFAAILPDTGCEDARAVVERIERAVAEGVQAPDDEPLSISCGLAELEPGMTAETLLDAADLAMMGAKAAQQPALRAA